MLQLDRHQEKFKRKPSPALCVCLPQSDAAIKFETIKVAASRWNTNAESERHRESERERGNGEAGQKSERSAKAASGNCRMKTRMGQEFVASVTAAGCPKQKQLLCVI